MALAWKPATAAPLVALGAWTCWLLFSEAAQEMSSVAVDCPDSVHALRFGNDAIDHFLCAIILFFKSALKTSHGLWISGYLLSIFMSYFAFMAVEGSRSGNSWLLSFTPVYGFLFQVCGISVVVPALWLPVYILSNAADRSPASLAARKISPRRVAFIKLFSLFVEFISVAMLIPANKLNKDLIIFIFQFAPVICPLFWLLFTSSRASDDSTLGGHRAVILLHTLQAGGALMLHLIGFVLVLDDPGIPSRLYELLWHHPGKDWCAFFLLVDACVLYLALLYLTCIEEGILVALSVLLATPLVGPGASLSLYFVYREEKLVKLLSSKDKNG